MSDTDAAGWKFDNTYARLPGALFVRVKPTPVASPELVFFNSELAHELELNADELGSSDGAEICAGNRLPVGADPIAQAYAGHQFGHFTMLGDGRAILLGEQVCGSGKRFDVHLKGSGPTPYSRRGDGRAALGPMLREALISEAIHALGIPTTRSLAVVKTGEPVYRESMLPGAVLVRVAASHIRVGTFEYAAAQQDDGETLRTLLNYAIQRHYPDAASADNPSEAFLMAVINSQASLIARWLGVGFVHGVMNTDNMALSGETIDYGPCAFLDTYDPATVFSSIDRNGRYAFGNQPGIALWNLTRFAETLLPILDSNAPRATEIATAALETFSEKFRHHWLTTMRAKLGLGSGPAADEQLVSDLLKWMHESKADFTNCFRTLDPTSANHDLPADWSMRWHARLQEQGEPADVVRARMQQSNPAVIPRNHLVEEALEAAGRDGDLAPFNALLSELANPFAERPVDNKFTQPPADGGSSYQTFCGT